MITHGKHTDVIHIFNQLFDLHFLQQALKTDGITGY